jgi:putative membrane protein
MTRALAGLSVLLVTVWLTPLAALADATGDGHYGAHGMWGGGWGGMLFGFLMMIVVIAAIAAAVVLVARALGGGHGKPTAGGGAGRGALAILEGRFARGEIDREEFEERRRILNED